MLSAWGQTYTISTLAGTGMPVNVAGTSVSLAYGSGLSKPPQYVAADAAGNVFLPYGETVLRLDATTGMLTLAAGNGNARLQRRQRPGHQRPIEHSHQPCGGLGRQPLHHGLWQHPYSQGLERGDYHRGGQRIASQQRRQRPRYQRRYGQSQQPRCGLCRQPLHRRQRQQHPQSLGRVHHHRRRGRGHPGRRFAQPPAPS